VEPKIEVVVMVVVADLQIWLSWPDDVERMFGRKLADRSWIRTAGL